MSPEGLYLVVGVPAALGAVRLFLPRLGKKRFTSRKEERIEPKPLIAPGEPLPTVEQDPDSSILRMREKIYGSENHKVIPIKKKVA